MISVDYTCIKCKHMREKIDGWICACDAFPEGIPLDIALSNDPPEEMKNCNNGIGFEWGEERRKIFRC